MGGIGSGGARIGAGRKPEGGEPKEKITVRVPLWLADLIHGEAARRRTSVASIAAELIRKGAEK